MQIDVGRHGFVELVDQLGDDTTVVNAARVSFGKRVSTFRDQDTKLLDYLVTHQHTSPFRHAVVQLHIKAPEYVARQFFKHVVGSDYAFKDTAWNEISGRYVKYDGTELDVPKQWRAAAALKKQGSGDALEPRQQDALTAWVTDHNRVCVQLYNDLLAQGVAPEQARVVLPLTFMTEWYWTASLQAVAHFVALRSDSHAQAEIQAYAHAIDELMQGAYPRAWSALRAKHVR